MSMFLKSSRHRYLSEDQGSFAYRRRVPDDVVPHVGVRVWKCRFKTKDRLEAERLVREKAHEHDRLIFEARGLPLPAKLEAWDFIVEDARSRLAVEPSDPEVVAAYIKANAAAAKIERAMTAAAEQRLDTLQPEEREAIEKAGGLEAFFRRVPRESQRVEFSGYSLGLRKAIGDDVEEAEAVQAVQVRRSAKNEYTLEKLGLLNAGDDSAFEDPSNPRIKSVLEPWFEERRQGSDAIKRHRLAINRFVELHGNVRVQDVTREMIKAYVKTVTDLTDHRHLPVHRRGGLAVVADLPKVSATTVDRHLISIKAMLTFCVEQGWLAVSPATGVKPPKDNRPKAARRRAMTREERVQFLNRAIAEQGEDGDRVWLIKLSAYLGCRLEEAAQLSRSNVKKFDGIWCIELDDLNGRQLKTQESVRVVPLHPAIRDEFLAWLEKTDTPDRDRVFMSFPTKNGRYSSKLSGDMGRLMDRAGLESPQLVMHSFRHGLAQAMIEAGIDGDMRRLILGHTVKDAHGDYLYASPAAKLKCLRKVRPLF